MAEGLSKREFLALSGLTVGGYFWHENGNPFAESTNAGGSGLVAKVYGEGSNYGTGSYGV